MPHKKILQDLINSATAAKTHYEVYWAQANEAKSSLLDTLNEHVDFFRASYDAHYVAFFVYLAHLFEKNRDSSCIQTYLSAIALTTDPIQFHDWQVQYKNLAERALPLIRARNKTVAHVDARLSESDVFGPLQITWDDVRMVIYDSAKFVAELAGTTELGSIGIPRDGRLIDSTLKMIRTLKEANRKHC